MKKIRILSIDGGGIRGIMPGVILTYLEERLQQLTEKKETRIADAFDFMAGTSTGGILTLAYLIPNETGTARYTAQDAVNLYFDRGDEIFDVSLWQKLRSGGGISDEKYDAQELEDALHENFGDTMLSELIKPCIVTSYDIKNARPHFFKQHKSSNNIYDFTVKDAARATSAAPTYFEVARIKNAIETPFPLVDGGVFANNPALVAYSEVRTMDFTSFKKPTAKDMMIVSIGTGSNSKPYKYKKAKNWGAVGWIKPVIEIMMSGNSMTVHHHLQQIFGTLEKQDQADYHRLEPKVITADSEMDHASVANMTRLKEDALTFLSDESINSELDEIARKLIDYGK